MNQILVVFVKVAAAALSLFVLLVGLLLFIPALVVAFVHTIVAAALTQTLGLAASLSAFAAPDTEAAEKL